MINARVVAGGQPLAAELVGLLHQGTELQPLVAPGAGVRRSPRVVLVDEVVDDGLEAILVVERVEGNLE